MIGGFELKALIIYDSRFGNTEKIAHAIGEAVTPLGEAKVVQVGEANPSEGKNQGLAPHLFHL